MSNFEIEKKLCGACKADEYKTVKEILEKAKAEGYKLILMFHIFIEVKVQQELH